MTYNQAYQRAQADANWLHRPMGIEKAREYGHDTFNVKMIPIRPQDRFGWETRVEVVEPFPSS